MLATSEIAEEYVCEIKAKSAEENQEVRSDAKKYLQYLQDGSSTYGHPQKL